MGVRDPVPWSWLSAILFPTLYSLPRPQTVTPLNGIWDHIGGYVGEGLEQVMNVAMVQPLLLLGFELVVSRRDSVAVALGGVATGLQQSKGLERVIAVLGDYQVVDVHVGRRRRHQGRR